MNILLTIFGTYVYISLLVATGILIREYHLVEKLADEEPELGVSKFHFFCWVLVYWPIVTYQFLTKEDSND